MTELEIKAKGIKRTIRLDVVHFRIELDERTNEWVIKIPDSDIRSILCTPKAQLSNVILEWYFDEMVGEEE